MTRAAVDTYMRRESGRLAQSDEFADGPDATLPQSLKPMTLEEYEAMYGILYVHSVEYADRHREDIL